MTDIDAPARYAEPAADQTDREGNVGLVVALALGLAIAAVALAMISREMAEPFVLAILGGLAVVGVFCLFAGAVGILHFGQNQARNDVTKAFVDNLPQGALIADQSGRVLYANEAYRNLLELPKSVTFTSTINKDVDLVHHFTAKKSELSRALASYRKKLDPHTVVWVS
jgi:two-component system cell cycle sensor histidine kinase/response regulator CckA